MRVSSHGGTFMKGFTLIEVMIGLALAAILMLAITSMTQWQMRGQKTGSITHHAQVLESIAKLGLESGNLCRDNFKGVNLTFPVPTPTDLYPLVEIPLKEYHHWIDDVTSVPVAGSKALYRSRFIDPLQPWLGTELDFKHPIIAAIPDPLDPNLLQDPRSKTPIEGIRASFRLGKDRVQTIPAFLNPTEVYLGKIEISLINNQTEVDRLSPGSQRKIASGIGSPLITRKIPVRFVVSDNGVTRTIEGCSVDGSVDMTLFDERGLYTLTHPAGWAHDMVQTGEKWECPAGKIYLGKGTNHECASLHPSSGVTLDDATVTWRNVPLSPGGGGQASCPVGGPSPCRYICPSDYFVTGFCKDPGGTGCANGGAGGSYEVKCTKFNSDKVRLPSSGREAVWRRRCYAGEAPTGWNGQDMTDAKSIDDDIGGLTGTSFNAMRCMRLFSVKNY